MVMDGFNFIPPADKAIRNDLLKRAKNSGFKTLIITADIPASSRRERLKDGWSICASQK